jgi:hypothetical protein
MIGQIKQWYYLGNNGEEKIYIRDAATYNLVEGKIQITKLKMMENLMKKSINIGEERR